LINMSKKSLIFYSNLNFNSIVFINMSKKKTFKIKLSKPSIWSLFLY